MCQNQDTAPDFSDSWTLPVLQ